MPNVIIACCVLHIIYQENNVRLHSEGQEILEQVIPQERVLRQQNNQNNNIVCNDFDQQRTS